MSCVSVVMEASLQVYSVKIPVNQAMSPLAWIIRHRCSQVFSLGASGGGTDMKSHEKTCVFCGCAINTLPIGKLIISFGSKSVNLQIQKHS